MDETEGDGAFYIEHQRWGDQRDKFAAHNGNMTKKSTLGMSDPRVEPLEILEIPEFVKFLKLFERDEGDFVHLVQSVHLFQSV